MRRILIVCALAVVLVVVAPFAGALPEGPRAEFVFWSLRVPRTLMGVLVGATLASAGAVYQQVFANPLATPSTVGTLAGATLGALAAIVLGLTNLGGVSVVSLAAFVGALLSSLLVASLAASRRLRMEDLLLAGIAVSLATSALATGLQYSADMAAAFSAARWSLGHLPQVGYQGVLLLTPFVVVTLAGLFLLTRSLQALVTGEDLAASQGVDTARVRTLALGLGALGVAACVAWCGPIGFVGLIVPHLVRLTVGAATHRLLPLSAVMGAAFLVTCDVAARLTLPGRELPVGVLTAALGAPALVLLLVRNARRAR
jgi:iron complex transport system permease protein